MNKQLIAKDDKIHNLEVRNQNLENEIRYFQFEPNCRFQASYTLGLKIKNLKLATYPILTWHLYTDTVCRTLKDQNATLARTQQSEEEHRKMLDKIASLRRKLADMEVKNTKLKEEKHGMYLLIVVHYIEQFIINYPVHWNPIVFIGFREVLITLGFLNQLLKSV